MKTERQLLKEAAAQLEHLMSACDMTNHLEEETIMLKAKINAHLSQPDAVAMSWTQALDKIASTVGYEYWSDLILREPLEDILTYCEAAHIFMESNRVQRWIPVEERLPDVGQYCLIYGLGGRQFTGLFSENVFQCYNPFNEMLEEAEEVTHWQPLPEVPGVYLEGNK